MIDILVAVSLTYACVKTLFFLNCLNSRRREQRRLERKLRNSIQKKPNGNENLLIKENENENSTEKDDLQQKNQAIKNKSSVSKSNRHMQQEKSHRRSGKYNKFVARLVIENFKQSSTKLKKTIENDHQEIINSSLETDTMNEHTNGVAHNNSPTQHKTTDKMDSFNTTDITRSRCSTPEFNTSSESDENNEVLTNNFQDKLENNDLINLPCDRECQEANCHELIEQCEITVNSNAIPLVDKYVAVCSIDEDMHCLSHSECHCHDTSVSSDENVKDTPHEESYNEDSYNENRNLISTISQILRTPENAAENVKIEDNCNVNTADCDYDKKEVTDMVINCDKNLELFNSLNTNSSRDCYTVPRRKRAPVSSLFHKPSKESQTRHTLPRCFGIDFDCAFREDHVNAELDITETHTTTDPVSSNISMSISSLSAMSVDNSISNKSADQQSHGAVSVDSDISNSSDTKSIITSDSTSNNNDFLSEELCGSNVNNGELSSSVGENTEDNLSSCVSPNQSPDNEKFKENRWWDRNNVISEMNNSSPSSLYPDITSCNSDSSRSPVYYCSSPSGELSPGLLCSSESPGPSHYSADFSIPDDISHEEADDLENTNVEGILNHEQNKHQFNDYINNDSKYFILYLFLLISSNLMSFLVFTFIYLSVYYLSISYGYSVLSWLSKTEKFTHINYAFKA